MKSKRQNRTRNNRRIKSRNNKRIRTRNNRRIKSRNNGRIRSRNKSIRSRNKRIRSRNNKYLILKQLKGGALETQPHYFLLIPGSNNRWGKGREDPAFNNTPQNSEWQTTIQEKVETDPDVDFLPNIITIQKAPPTWQESGSAGALKGFEKELLPIAESVGEKSISVIATSNGAAIIIHLLCLYPQIRSKIKNVVINSPAFVTGNPWKDIAKQYNVDDKEFVNNFNGIPLLYVDTEHGYGNYNFNPSHNNNLRKYANTQSQIDNGCMNFSMPTTQHSGDTSLKTNNKCRDYGARYASIQCNCPDKLSSEQLDGIQIKVQTIWGHIFEWCKKNDSIGRIQESRKILQEIETINQTYGLEPSQNFLKLIDAFGGSLVKQLSLREASTEGTSAEETEIERRLSNLAGIKGDYFTADMDE